MSHVSVLLKEILDGLNIQKGDVFLDATLGNAGHSLEVCKTFGKEVRIVGIDQDKERINHSQKILRENNCNFSVIESNFRNIDKVLDQLEIKKADKILYDLGLNSEQLENSNRGFSFQKNEPLLMNYGENPEFTARDIVNEWKEESINDILWGYGEEKFSRQIAKKIVELREENKIETTKDLVTIIEKAVPNWYKHKKTHFATKTFQALRITVNDEIKALEESLQKSFERLSSSGRIAVISFHSGDDRLVKRYFRDLKNKGVAELLTKKPILPGNMEVNNNPRSRSAKLRIIEKKPVPLEIRGS
jgi:16S rRNA (cytosine1402-N4)-methyltransferase